MAVALTILTDPGDAAARRTLTVAPGTTILKAAHAAGVDITATCGGRGRCTSCRVKFIEGAVPPPTIMDELQLGGDLVRDGYRLSCQCRVTEPITVELAPPLDERAFQILGAGAGVAGRIPIESGVVKHVGKVALPREEHHQTSHIEQLTRESGVLAKWIYKVVIVGNTCMHHLLLGIDPSYVGLAPYAPVLRHPLVIPARELHLTVASEARVCLLPIVAGFVGADAVAVALATRIPAHAAVRAAVGIGTNDELLPSSRYR